MIEIPKPAIPTAFQKLDSRITTADGFVNVRDQQIARSNHNILLARRIRGNCMSCHLDTSPDLAAVTVTPFMSKQRPPIIYSGNFLVNPLCRTLRVAIKAKRTRATPATNPVLGFFLWPWGAWSTPSDEAAINKLTITSTTAAWYTVDIALAYHFQNDSKIAPRVGGKIPVGFSIYSLCQIDVDVAATIASAAIVTATDRDIRFTSAISPATGSSLEVDSSWQNPSLIIASSDLGADNIVTIDPPFSTAPLISDTVTMRPICAIVLESIFINDLTISDFDTASAAI